MMQIKLPLEPRRHLTPSETLRALSQRPEHQGSYLPRELLIGRTQFNSYGEIVETSEDIAVRNHLRYSQNPEKYGQSIRSLKGGLA